MILPFFEIEKTLRSLLEIAMNFETTENNTINDLKRALEEKEAECKFLLEDLYLRK